MYAQNRQGMVYDMVSEQAQILQEAPKPNLFKAETAGVRNHAVNEVIADGTILALDAMEIFNLRKQELRNFKLEVPRNDGPAFNLELIESTVLAEDFTVFASSNPNLPVDYRPGKHYMGIVEGDRSSVVSVSIFDNHIVGLISTDEGNFTLAQIEDTRDQYVLYNDKNLIPEFNLGCETPDDGVGYTVEELTPQSTTRGPGDCVRIYVEVHEDITNDKGSVSNATDYVTAVFNQSAILYANDGITITVSEMFVWNTTSPYTSNSTSTLLDQFQANVGNFNGDLGHLVGYAGGGGIAAGFSGICNPNPDNSMCYSGINPTYSNVPTYSWTVMVVTHEMGHLFGSRHTHACVWNGNNTAIDGCAGSTEGSCSLPGNPSNGGTIMSYCHITPVGINLNNGFGPQPSTVVNNSVNNGSCLSACSNPSCDVPGGLSTSSVADNSATLNWNSTSNANDYTVNYRQTGASSWNSATTSSTNYNLSGLTAGTSYEWRVRGNCSGGSSTYSANVSFTTTGTPPISYCSSQGNNVTYEWIAGVSVSNLTNNTGANGGYGDFTGQSADLDEGSTYTISLTPGFSSSTYTEFWRVWIDYNGDGDFTDAGELAAAASGTGSVSPSFTVPTSVSATSTRMRISMKWDANATSCEAFPYGEVEDYTVNISSGPPPTCGVPTGLSESNIAQSTATLTWNAVSSANDYTVQLRVVGSATWDVEGVINGTSANATGLIADTDYEWHVRSNCTSGSSAYSPVSTFTTEGSSGGGCTYQTINFNNFESGWGIWNDGGSDCRRSSGDANYALGTYCVRLRDNTSSSVMTTDNLNLANYDEVTVDFSYYPRSMDNSNEDFWLQVSTNGGASYATIEEWNRGDEFNNNTRYYDQVVMTGTFTSNTRFRFRCDASGNSDWIYIDEVEISGCNNAAIYTPRLESTPAVIKEEIFALNNDELEELDTELNDGFLVYPNPTADVLNVEFLADTDQEITVLLTATNGQVVKQLNQQVEAGENDMTFSVRNTAAGLYALTVVTNDDVLTKMVVIQK